MEPARQFEVLFPAFRAVVEAIGPDQLDLPTPCAEWSVRDVLHHMTSGARNFAASLRGGEGEDSVGIAADAPSDVLASVQELIAAFEAPDASERSLMGLPFGAMSGEGFSRYVAFDLLMHTWDLATATGRSLTIPDDVVGAVDEYVQEFLTSELRAPGLFDPATEPPPGANALERLVAYSGRDAGWSPSS